MADFVDVSEYQGKPNWNAVKGAGYVAAVVKATEYRVDHSFSYNWHAVKAAGLGRSAYCFGRPNFSPEDQANRFWEVVSGAGYDKTDLPLVLDAEVPGLTVDWCVRFLDRLGARSGKTPIFYTYKAFLQSTLGNNPRLQRWPLWIAAYQNTAPKTPWPAWAWQYSSSGNVPGINGRCDVNHVLGSGLPIGGSPVGEDDTLAAVSREELVQWFQDRDKVLQREMVAQDTRTKAYMEKQFADIDHQLAVILKAVKED